MQPYHTYIDTNLGTLCLDVFFMVRLIIAKRDYVRFHVHDSAKYVLLSDQTHINHSKQIGKILPFFFGVSRSLLFHFSGSVISGNYHNKYVAQVFGGVKSVSVAWMNDVKNSASQHHFDGSTPNTRQ